MTLVSGYRPRRDSRHHEDGEKTTRNAGVCEPGEIAPVVSVRGASVITLVDVKGVFYRTDW